MITLIDKLKNGSILTKIGDLPRPSGRAPPSLFCDQQRGSRPPPNARQSFPSGVAPASAASSRNAPRWRPSCRQGAVPLSSSGADVSPDRPTQPGRSMSIKDHITKNIRIQ